ncbi:MAG: ATP-binding cassette domain-containing protein [Saprospiraceae bacterium]|nr:ATP-binding cassette domain-containing protein [Saprospiraceae bacterium]
MLNIKDLEVSYSDKTVLHDFHLNIQTGSILGLLGRNGAGKTTLYNSIYQRIKPQKGQIHWKNQKIKTTDIAYLETHPYFYSYMTAKEYLQLASNKNPSFPIDEWNKVFQLPLQEYATSYSTGMKKQLAFLATIALDRPFLLLDEPFNGLDFESSEKLYRILEKLRQQNKTILVSSHIMETITNICDEVAHLKEGQIAQKFIKSEFPSMEKSLRKEIYDEVDQHLDRLF